MTRKILLVYNPISGKNANRSSTILNFIMEAAKEYIVCVYQIKESESLDYVLAGAEREYDFLVCCGGDGTLHHFTNSLLHSDVQLPLAYIPLGSTNDNAKSLGINRSNAISVALKGRTCCIDVGRFNNHYFDYVAAFGMFTNVSYNTPQNLKNALGYLAYLLEGIRQMGNLSGIDIAISTDDATYSERFLVGIISNSLSVAGVKQKNVNRESLTDGMMDYIFIKEPKNIIDIQKIISELLSGKCDNKHLYTGRSRCFSFRSEAMKWTLDGEYGGSHEEVYIETVSNRLEMKVGY